jgi:anhydro-N-acetylmuramic acid kinase
MVQLSKIKKIKKQRFLILSAGGPQSGIQCIYILVEGDAWETLAHAIVPYPDPVEQLIETLILTPRSTVELERLAWLDQKLSWLFLECAQNALAHAHSSNRQPHVIVMNACTLWNGRQGENQQAKSWDISLGDAQLLASTFNAPVITGFVRHSNLAGGAGQLPLFPGNIKVAKSIEPISSYLNIGLIAHLTIVDNQAMHTVLDSDVGPGTCLINMAARDAGCKNGFDRDGSNAAKGAVDNNCVEVLSSQEWFAGPSPKQAFLQDFIGIYDQPCVRALSPLDKIATLTALTARTAFEFFKREYRHALSPEVIRVSGGGAHNLALLDYLSTYLDPVQVKSVEESGIPAALRDPLALGLTVHEYLLNHPGPWKAGAAPEIQGIGRWVFP